MASTNAAVDMDSTPTVEVIVTLLVARNCKGVFRRQTSALEYGGCCKDYFTYLLPSVPCGLSIYIRPLSIRRGRITFPSVVCFLGGGGRFNMLNEYLPINFIGLSIIQNLHVRCDSTYYIT